MAAAISPFFPFGVLSLCFLLALCNHANSISLDFVFNTTQTFSDAYLQRSGDAFFPTSEMIELTKNDRTGYINNSMGLVWYAQPVPLWSNATGELASFTTAFSFEIKIDDQSSTYEPGDGMTFFLTHYPPAPRNQTSSGGGDLGLFINGKNNLTGDFRAVAVEFDTYHNIQWNESQSQHIGIDINSIESVASTDTISPAVLVPSNSTSTVNYNSSTKLLAVDVRINGTLYHVNFTVDLREVLPEEVAVGFSASNGFSAEFHRVKNWSFSSTDLQQLQKTPARPEPSKKLLLMVLVPTIVLCAFAGLLLWLWKKPSRKLTRGGHSDSEDEQHNDGAELERGVIGPKRYHSRDLADATSDFAEERKLGRGGFGSVYRGLLRSDDQLPDGVPVAIKVFSSESSSQGRKEFEAEVRIISQLRHRNLVRLLGWCDSRKGLLLVYELEPEGSLDKHIYNSDRLLTWSERYKIILGLGSALSYLHQDWEQCIVHGDIKPSNIMLDTSYNTKLGDFGLARLVDHGTGPCTTNLIQGTAGYIDPEFVNTRQRSTQSDIYSFGIVLLEIVSGRQPVVNHEGVPPFMLLKWVWGLYRRNMTLDAADGRLRGGDGLYERQMERALVVGLWCAHPDLGQRPSIAQAMHVLQSEDAKLPALSLEMYIAPPLNLGVGGNGGGDNSSNFSSGVPSSATTGTTRSTGSFVN